MFNIETSNTKTKTPNCLQGRHKRFDETMRNTDQCFVLTNLCQMICKNKHALKCREIITKGTVTNMRKHKRNIKTRQNIQRKALKVFTNLLSFAVSDLEKNKPF